MLPPPDEQQVQILNKLNQENNWLGLLKFAEARIIEFRFWLDLSYYAYKALSNLKQLATAQELAYEVLIYIKRLRGIEQLTFANGTAFANSETQAWLAELSQEVTPPSAATSNDQELAREIEAAKQLITQGKLAAALNHLHTKLQASLSHRERFVRILYFCRFVDSIKQAELAKPYLTELLESSRTYQLDAWEPELVSRAYQLILSMARQKKLKLSDDLLQDTLNRLRIIDPVSSLKFQ
jgi:type VI secretion system protein VasJ